MSFHATEKGWILYQGTVCEDTGSGRWGGGKDCWDEVSNFSYTKSRIGKPTDALLQTYYTKDAFKTTPQKLLSQTTKCSFAHQNKDFAPPTPALTSALIFCVAFDQSHSGSHDVKESRLFSSTDWFENVNDVVDLGIGRAARGVVGLGMVSKFVVAAINVDAQGGGKGDGGDPMHLYATTDAKNWNLMKFPHGSMKGLKENGYVSLLIFQLHEKDSLTAK